MQYSAMRLSPEDRAYLDERYGANNRKRWPVYIVSVLVTAFIVWIAWAYWAEIHPKVTSGQTSQELNYKGTLTSKVTFQVIRADKSVVATCKVEILASNHATVGVLQQQIPMSSPTNFTTTWTVKTSQPGYAVQWDGCTAPGQDTPK